MCVCELTVYSECIFVCNVKMRCSNVLFELASDIAPLNARDNTHSFAAILLMTRHVTDVQYYIRVRV